MGAGEDYLEGNVKRKEVETRSEAVVGEGKEEDEEYYDRNRHGDNSGYEVHIITLGEEGKRRTKSAHPKPNRTRLVSEEARMICLKNEIWPSLRKI